MAFIQEAIIIFGIHLIILLFLLSPFFIGVVVILPIHLLWEWLSEKYGWEIKYAYDPGEEIAKERRAKERMERGEDRNNLHWKRGKTNVRRRRKR